MLNLHFKRYVTRFPALNKHFAAITFFTISLIFTLLSSNHFFFWDSISQISIPANWYYENGFKLIFLPDDISTGHPPLAGMYFALMWRLFGRSLFVSHIALFPFIFGILYQVYRYLESSDLKKKYRWLILIIIVLDATLLSQMSMISFDIIQIFFFLWCINSIILKKDYSLAIAFTGLCMISLRGTICGGGVIIFGVIYNYLNSNKITLRSIVPYSVGIICFLMFLLAFYLEKHWIIHNVVSKKWQQSSEIASFYEIIRNFGILGWRLVDFGRLSIWIVFVYIIFNSIRRKTLYDKYFRTTLLIAVSQFIIFLPVLILFKNFIGHRYLLPIIIPVIICTFYWVISYSVKPILLCILLIFSTVSGNFWIYPKNIAQGWDATPSHWPYYKIRKEMITWMKADSIPIDKTGSFFPNLASFKLTDLSEDTLAFKEADFSHDTFILFSNVFNLQDAEIDELFSNNRWEEIKKIEYNRVYMILFKRNQ